MDLYNKPILYPIYQSYPLSPNIIKKRKKDLIIILSQIKKEKREGKKDLFLLDPFFYCRSSTSCHVKNIFIYRDIYLYRCMHIESVYT